MKKYLFLILLTLITTIGPLTLPSQASAACVNNKDTETGATCFTITKSSGSGAGPNAPASNLEYTPLEPIPGFTVGTNLTNPNSLPNLINLAFKILITIGALAAVLSLTIGGIQYMISEAVQNKKAGLNRARSSLFAILLIASVWLILNTVNPELLKFTFNPCPDGTKGCTVTKGTALGSINNTPSVTSGTIDPNSTQGKALQEELCAAASYLSTCYSKGTYVTYNSSNQNNQTVKDFIANCESWNTSYVYFSKAITFSGDKVGAPGNTGVACVSPILP